MKTLAFLALGAAVLLAGCDSMSDHVSMSDRMASVPPKTQNYAASLKQVSEAAQVAFKRLDFRLTRTKLGEIEAVSRIDSSVAMADSRQLVAHVHLEEADGGQTEVDLSLVEEVQSQSMGGSHQEELKEHSFFSLYFTTLQQVLLEQKGQGRPGKS